MVFSALAYALSWGWWAPMVWPYLSQITLRGPLPSVVERGSVRVPLGMFGPLVAAMIMRLFVTREWLNGTLGVIRPWRYYAVAVLAPRCGTFLLIGLNYPNQTLSTVLPVFGIAVVLMAFPFTWLF